MNTQGSRLLLDTIIEASSPRVLLRLSDRDVTGTIIGPGIMPGEVRVRWDDTEEVTHIERHRLVEAVYDKWKRAPEYDFDDYAGWRHVETGEVRWTIVGVDMNEATAEQVSVFDE